MPKWWDQIVPAEQERLVHLYVTGEIGARGLLELLAQSGIQTTLESIHNLFRRRGWKHGSQSSGDLKISETVTPPDPVIITPEIINYKAPKTGEGDPEEQILHATDHHSGKITPSYDPDVYKARMEYMFNSMLTITKLHRHIYPINVLNIFLTGDMVQGENPHQGSRIESVAMGARNQVKQLALPAWVSFLLSARQEFAVVRLWGVGGNHGKYDPLAPETSNWDLMLYDNIQNAVGHYDGIEVHVSDEFYQFVDIQGYKFLLVHGDQVKANQGIPLFAWKRRLDQWYIQFGGFDYVCSGHWHKFWWDETTARYQSICSASLVSDDQWALAKIGISSFPSQWTFGVHERHGVTWRYQLEVDPDYRIREG